MGFLAALGVFSSLSLNLALQFGLGMRSLSIGRKGKQPAPFLEAGVIFLSVLILWLFFTFLLAPLQLGFFWYILLFPLSVLACTGVEWFLTRLVSDIARAKAARAEREIADGEEAEGIEPPVPPVRSFPPAGKRSVPLFRRVSGYDGLIPLALLMTLHLGITIVEAAVLSFGFALGILLAALILNEIRRRSSLEAVPHFLRGAPLTIISMGLLSLIFTFAGGMFLNALGF